MLQTGGLVPDIDARKDVLSYHTYKNNCTNKSIQIPIEPLVGLLRHPHAICKDDMAAQSKNCMFSWSRFEWHQLKDLRESNRDISSKILKTSSRRCETRENRYLFDMGCSTYSTGAGGSSLDWFVETYRRHGIEFDRIFAWEKTLQNADKLFAGFPLDVLSKLSYFNVGVLA
eukprot:gene25489-31135_t